METDLNDPFNGAVPPINLTVFVNLDNDFDKALNITKVLFPHSRFSFKINKVKDETKEKNMLWQIALVQDNKDLNVPFMYVQGEGKSQSDAIAKLLSNLTQKVSDRGFEIRAEIVKMLDKHEEQLMRLDVALWLCGYAPIKWLDGNELAAFYNEDSCD